MLIPEGLLNYVAAYKHLIDEINRLFEDALSKKDVIDLSQKLYENEAFVKEHLTPWSFSLYVTLPDFLKKQILYEREVSGSVKIS